LRQKIDKIKNEEFDAKSKVLESAVLTKQIRTIGVQQLNFDVEKPGKKYEQFRKSLAKGLKTEIFNKKK